MVTRTESMHWRRGKDHLGTRWSINTGQKLLQRTSKLHGKKAIRDAGGAISHEVIGPGLCLDSRVRRTGCEHAMPGGGMERDRKDVIGRPTVV